ncbi:MAG: NYN domain-containing protein, partial [Bacteroidetes bacterium]|nr:NYN domain-containing protein [Bacteroidota bacterium]
MNKRTVILVDGGFFIKRYRAIIKPTVLEAKKVASDLCDMCIRHLSQSNNQEYDLYRILYYDCLPYDKKQHNPVTGKAVDFSKTDQYKFQVEFFEELKKKRKVALRLGELRDHRRWIIRPEKVKELLNKDISVDDL